MEEEHRKSEKGRGGGKRRTQTPIVFSTSAIPAHSFLLLFPNLSLSFFFNPSNSRRISNRHFSAFNCRFLFTFVNVPNDKKNLEKKYFCVFSFLGERSGLRVSNECFYRNFFCILLNVNVTYFSHCFKKK